MYFYQECLNCLKTKNNNSKLTNITKQVAYHSHYCTTYFINSNFNNRKYSMFGKIIARITD